MTLARDQSASRSVLATIAIGCLLALPGCSVMDSREVLTYSETAPTDKKCQSHFGAYALPKTLIKIEVKGTTDNPRTAQTALTEVQEISAADRIYCLDYLSSPFAKDTIKVWKGDPTTDESSKNRAPTSSTQLLSFVSSNTIDYTSDIVRNILRAVFVAISRKPDFTPIAAARTAVTKRQLNHILASYTFDPFDLDALVQVNRDLRPLGYCVLFEIVPGDQTQRNGPRFCASPDEFAVVRKPFFKAYVAYNAAEDAPTRVPGIAYRVRLPYRLFIYAKDDPTGSKPWRLLRAMHVRMENISPVFSVGVQRAVFATRRTAFIFDRGVLLNYCVSKTSEINSALEIPLEVMRSIIALPDQTLLAELQQMKESKALADAEIATIQAQQELIKFLANPKENAPPEYDDKRDPAKKGAPDPFPEYPDISKTFKALSGPGTSPDFSFPVNADLSTINGFANICEQPMHTAGSKP